MTSFCLTLIEPKGKISTTVFDQGEVTIGRSSQNHYRPDPVLYSQVSRNHAKIIRRGPGQFIFEDLDSTQGSYLDGREVKGRILLNRDDVIMLGRDGPSVSITWAKDRITGHAGTHYRMSGRPSASFPLAFSERFEGKYGHYEKIGSGGFGEVWRGVPIDNNGNSRAIKLLHPLLLDPDNINQDDRQSLISRFAREAQVTHQLSQTGAAAIVKVHSWGDDADRDYLFLVMDYIEGESFDCIIRRGEMPVQKAALLMAQVAEALEAAHNFEFLDEMGNPCRGVIHRDVKPGNIIIQENEGKAWIVDFGVAGILEGGQRLTATNIAVGTHLYLPPEAISSKMVTPASDLWGFCVTLYLCLSGGHYPFALKGKGINTKTIIAETYTPINRLRKDLPEELSDALTRSLGAKPENRLQTARDWTNLLRKYASE